MILAVALLLAVLCAAFVAWPLLRRRESADRLAEEAGALPDAWPALESELWLDAAAGRLPAQELGEVLRQAREALQATE